MPKTDDAGMQPSVEPAFETARQSLALVATSRTCRRCEREGRPAQVDDPDLQVCPRCRSALKANALARKHGLRSRPEMHPDSAREFLNRVDRVLVDAGQRSEPTYTFLSQARDYIRLELLIETGFNTIADSGGSPKVVDQLLALIGTKARLAAQIGLVRRATDVDIAQRFAQLHDQERDS